MLRDVPKMLLDPLHPLVVRLGYLPKSLPWLWRFKHALAPSRAEAIAGARAALLSRAGTEYESLLAEIGRPDLIRSNGLAQVYQSEASFRGAQGGIAMRRRHGIEVRVLSGDELRAMEPALSDKVVAGAYFPAVQTVVNPVLLAEAIVASFRERGGRLLTETVKGFETGPAGVSKVVTDAGAHDVDLVVVSAGAWSRDLVALLGEKVSVTAERGYHVMIEDAAHLPEISLVSGDHNVSIVTLNTGLRFTTMAEFTAIDAPPDHPRAQRIFEAAAGVIRDLTLKVGSRWVGSRPSTPDSLPVIGRSPKHRNVIYAFGHGHLGVTFGAVTGAIVGTLARDEVPNMDISAYRPDRGFDGSHLAA
jgi:D-amino-acid dehydrogenase